MDEYFVANCTSIQDNWTKPELLIYEPFKKKGDLFNPFGSTLIFSEKAYDVLVHLLEVSGEILDFSHNGESFYLFNVLNCVNCLDRSKVW